MSAMQKVVDKARKRIQSLSGTVEHGSHMFRPEVRLQGQARMLSEFVNAGDSLLDVGCGTGHLSANLEELYAVKPVGLDVKDFRQRAIEFAYFSSTSIPFGDRGFDHVLLSFSLHHAQDPMVLIRECHRVARRSLIIFEDLPTHAFGKFMLFLHVWWFSLRYPFKPAKLSEYRSALAWLADHAEQVTRVTLPPEWLHRVYARDLLVYTLPERLEST